MPARKKKQIPAWVAPHFTAALDSQVNLMRAVSISRKGIMLVTRLPRITKALARVNDKPDPNPAFQKLVEEDAELAESEISNDFPVLHSLATVGLWSWLEHLVKGIAVEWIKHDKAALSAAPIQKLRVRLSDYLALTKTEQAAYIVELLEQETSSSLKRGINRFESLLEPLGLSGPVSPETAKTLFELQQVRNAIAHQNGRCDRKLKANCPWLKVKVGASVNISPKWLESYSGACMDYGLQLLYRIGDIHEVDLREDRMPPNQTMEPTR